MVRKEIEQDEGEGYGCNGLDDGGLDADEQEALP